MPSGEDRVVTVESVQGHSHSEPHHKIDASSLSPWVSDIEFLQLRKRCPPKLGMIMSFDLNRKVKKTCYCLNVSTLMLHIMSFRLRADSYRHDPMPKMPQ